MRNQATLRCLTISAGAGKRVLDQDMGRYRRQYTVSVQSDATGVTRRFTFTDSVHNEDGGKVGISGTELLYAFRCFVEDGQMGAGSFEDMASEFGWSVDSYSARQTFKACQAAARKFRELWSTDVEPGDILDELSRLGVE